MAANSICDVSGHHEPVKKLMYSPKKCSICKKRCLFGLKKMVKCIACKCVMHKKCRAYEADVEHRGIRSATTAAVVTSQCVLPFENVEPVRAENDKVLFQVTADGAVGPSAVVPTEVLLTSATPSSWLKQDEILGASIAASREVQYVQEALQAVHDLPAKKTQETVNEPEVVAPFAVALRPIWTGSMMVSDRFSWLCMILTYDPAVGPAMRIVLRWAVLSTSAATGPSWTLMQLILVTSAGTGPSWLLPELILLASAATRPSCCQVQHDVLLKDMLKEHDGGDAKVIVPDHSGCSCSAVCSECRYTGLCVSRTFHSAFGRGARVLLRPVVPVDLFQTSCHRIHAKNAVTQNALPAASRVTAFECIKTVLKDKQNAERKQHRANVNVPSVFHIVVSRKLELDLSKSKLTKSDYLKLCEPWTFKKVKKNEAERNVYSLTITNSKFKNFHV